MLCTQNLNLSFVQIFPLQNPLADHRRLQEIGTYYEERRRLNQWVPELILQER